MSITELLGVCIHGVILAPYDLPGMHPRYSRGPDDPVTSSRCTICRTAWHLREDPSGWVTERDLAAAEEWVAIREEADARWQQQREQAMEQLREWQEEHPLVRETCPACLREISLKPSNYDKPFGDDFTHHGGHDTNYYGERRVVRRCPAKDVWRWTDEPVTRWSFNNSWERMRMRNAALALLDSIQNPEPASVSLWTDRERPSQETRDYYLQDEDVAWRADPNRTLQIAWRNMRDRGIPLWRGLGLG